MCVNISEEKYHYYPSYWTIIKCDPIKEGETGVDKLLCGFYGGYLDGDEWRMSSGITKVTEIGDHYFVENKSGSIYKCHKRNEGLGTMTTPIYNRLVEVYQDKVSIIKIQDYSLLNG